MNATPPTASNPSPTPSPAYKWWVVFMLWFVCFFNYADRQAIFSVFPKLKEEFGFDKVQLGLIGSAFMWVYAFGAPLAGYVGDRVRRKDLILGGCLFWSAVTVMTGWCGKLWQFVAVRALEGFGETFYFPASMSLTSDYHGPATRSRRPGVPPVERLRRARSRGAGWVPGSRRQHGWRSGFYFFGGAGSCSRSSSTGSCANRGAGESELGRRGNARRPGAADGVRPRPRPQPDGARC